MRGRLRTVLPFVASALAMGATFLVGSVMTWVLMFVSVAFLMDGATLLWSRSGTSMDQHRQ